MSKRTIVLPIITIFYNCILVCNSLVEITHSANDPTASKNYAQETFFSISV